MDYKTNQINNIYDKCKNNKGIALILLVLIIVLILATAFTSIYFAFYYKDNTKVIEISKEDINSKTKLKVEKIRNLGIDARIVADITEDNVPIPDGFTYVQGNKETGTIIETKQLGVQYLYIPYNENVSTGKNIDEYYNKVDNYYYMDLTTLESIEKYEGFYVLLNSNKKLDDLKKISKKDYELQYEQLQDLFEDTDSVKAHMLYKEEIAQINYYLKNNNIDIGENTIGIQALVIETFSKINVDELIFTRSTEKNDINTVNINEVNNKINQNMKIEKLSNNNLIKLSNTITTTISEKKNEDYIFYYQTSSKLYGGDENTKVNIPIPSGFDYCETKSGAVKIQDLDNENLKYIWVPFNIEFNKETFVQDVKSEFEKLYDEYYKKNNKSDKEYEKQMISLSKEEIKDDNFWKSIEKYNGFYISEAELSKGKDKRYMNIARGMNDSSVTKTKEGGDYIRANKVSDITLGEEAIFSKMNIEAEDSNIKTSIKSHLMYGIEYDLALLWIADTNQDYKDKFNNDIYTVLCGNSTWAGKYTNNTDLLSSIEANQTETFNGIWGLGGNLAELTPEIYIGRYVARGGSYKRTGEQAPIASRNIYSQLANYNDKNTTLGDEIGVRTALYINPNIFSKGTVESFNYLPIENSTRYVKNYEGTLFYEFPDVNSQLIQLDFAYEVVATSKSTQTEEINGKKYQWVKATVTFKNGYKGEGYINTEDLTTNIEYIESGEDDIGKIKFVIKEETVTRYCKNGTRIYDKPNDNGTYNVKQEEGQIQLIGKSVNQEWAVIKVNSEHKYVKAEDLES